VMAERKRRPRDRCSLRDAPWGLLVRVYGETVYRAAMAEVPPWPGPHQARVQRLVSPQGHTLAVLIGCPNLWKQIYVPEEPAPLDWMPQEAVERVREQGCSELAFLPPVPYPMDDSDYSVERAKAWWKDPPFNLDPNADKSRCS
jgi:hypothetical protein